MATKTFWIDAMPNTGAILLKGDLDLSGVKSFEAAVRKAVRDGGPVTLDASELMFMDSTGIRLLVHLAKRLEGRGCVIIHGLTETVRKVIELTGIDQLENLHLIPHKRPLPTVAMDEVR